MRHAGMGWSNGPIAGGNERILALPSPDLLMLGSEHWHYDEAVRAGKRVLFRGMARQGFRPAELGWNVKQYVDEILRDAVRVSEPITDFVGWNEWNLQDERGDQRPDEGGLTTLFTLLGGFQFAVLTELRNRPVTKHARLHFGAWAPKDETDYVEHWRAAAELADVMDVHAYGPGPGILAHADKYRSLFPSTPIELTEWHSNFDGPETDRDTLGMLANYAAVHQDFRAYYFLYRWFDPPAHQRDLAKAIAVEGNPERYDLFREPPRVVVPAPEPPLIVEPEPIPEPIPMSANPWEHWSAAQIAEAAQVPQEAVEETWPHVVAQLELCGINRPKVQIGVIGTMAHETASAFRPVREAFYKGEPEPAETYRKTLDYYPHYGRGHVQLTHAGNYARYTAKLAELWGPGAPDLTANPDDALDADVAAAVIALWFRDERALPTATWPEGYSLQNACDLDDDEWIRRLVYGGRDPIGQARIARVRSMLEHGMVPAELHYDPSQPPERQIQSWACSIRATTWALKSVGVQTDAGALQDEMVPGTVTPALGLLDGRGYGLAAILGRHLPVGTNIEVIENASMAQVAARAGRGPICAGSASLYHWINIADLRGDGVLEAPNPAPSYQGIGDDLTPEEFTRWAPWNIVFVEVVPMATAHPPADPSKDTLIGVAYHDDGVVIPALTNAQKNGDWGQVDAVIRWLRENNPHKAA